MLKTTKWNEKEHKWREAMRGAEVEDSEQWRKRERNKNRDREMDTGKKGSEENRTRKGSGTDKMGKGQRK